MEFVASGHLFIYDYIEQGFYKKVHCSRYSFYFEGRVFIWMFQVFFFLNIESFKTVVTLP